MKKIMIILGVLGLLVACEDFFEQDISGEKVLIIGPTEGAIIETGNITFAWRELQYASSYRVTIVSPDFAHAALVVADTLLQNDSIRTHSQYMRFLDPGAYQWSIRASNSVYTTAEQVYSLLIVAAPEPDPDPDPGEEEPGGDDAGGEEETPGP